MVAVSLSAFAGAGAQFLDTNGNPLQFGFINTYEPGSTTPAVTYTSSAGTSTNANPIPLDGSGRPPNEIWLLSSANYKFVVTNSVGGDARTFDNVPGITPASSFALLVTSAGAGMIGTTWGGTVEAQLDNTGSIGLFTAASGATIPAACTVVHTTGYSVTGLGQATYVYDATVNSAYVSAHPKTSFLSADSRGWRLDISNGVSVTQCGAKGDGVTDDLPAFNAAVAAFGPNLGSGDDASFIGGTIFVPRPSPTSIATTSGYFLNGSFAPTKGIHLKGQLSGAKPTTSGSKLIFPANTDGIVLNSFQVSATSDPQYSKIEDLFIYCQTKTSTGRGIVSSVVFFAENVYIQNFAGHGVQITGGGGAGNSDGFALRNMDIVGCGGDGVNISGSDAQIGTLFQVRCRTNTGWGFNSATAYGSSFYECQAAGNVAGSYKSASTTTGFGDYYYSCYVEFGTGDTPNLDSNALVIGGTLQNAATAANTIASVSGGLALNYATRLLFTKGGTEAARLESTGQFICPGGAQFQSGSGDNINIAGGNAIWKTGTGTGAANAINFQNGNGTVGSIATSGSATAYNTSSDYRLKSNIADLDPTASLARIMAVKAREFTWNADGAPHEGFIAHELAEQFPLAVTGEKDATQIVVDGDGNETTVPKYQGVDSSYLIAAMVSAMQGMAARLDALEAR